MRMILTLAMTLGFMTLTANVGSAQIVTIDKTNLTPPPANAPAGTPDTVQPEGKASVGQVPGTWEVKIMFGTIAAGVFTPFGNTPIIAMGIRQPTQANGQLWRVGGKVSEKANWVAPYYCKADLTVTINTVTSIQSTVHMQVR